MSQWLSFLLGPTPSSLCIPTLSLATTGTSTGKQIRSTLRCRRHDMFPYVKATKGNRLPFWMSGAQLGVVCLPFLWPIESFRNVWGERREKNHNPKVLIPRLSVNPLFNFAQHSGVWSLWMSFFFFVATGRSSKRHLSYERLSTSTGTCGWGNAPDWTNLQADCTVLCDSSRLLDFEITIASALE